MGEELINKEEEAKIVEDEKKELAPDEAPVEKKEEAAAGGEEGAKSPPPAVIILGVELHCTGCAKRIKRSILRFKGVEGVEVDMAANQVTVKAGIDVDPQALCARLHNKTKRKATLISPAADAQPEQLSDDEVRTVELLVSMHCDACAHQLHKKILKMRGVQTADTDLSAGKLTVTGTITDDKIVEYIHRRTGKLATVVPPPEPAKEEDQEPKKKEADKKPEDDDGKKEESGENKQPVEEAKDDANEKKEEGGVVVDGFPPEEMMKRMVYWPYGYKQHAEAEEAAMMARRMPHPYAMMQWMPPPPPAPVYYGGHYMMERPPQLFSDENPNACVIS